MMLVIIGVVNIFSPKIFSDNGLRINKKTIYNYRRKDFLMTRAEHEFFDVLVDVAGDQYYVFPQIHLATLLDNKIVGQNWRGAFRHVDEKSVDFVICNKIQIKPFLAIELDDRSHEREDRKERDKEVELILSEAGLPLLRVVDHGNFNKEEIKRLVFEKINEAGHDFEKGELQD